ncbi:FliC/FljB family flagellin [Pantoea agglomerans]|uniref:FliC/FljB family flagellin n=1 Tax=Enterobacter agglomerans TaxID=549 RepID=UPI001787079A|nr:FliC/FljB family flagellin [Pantoea agglomerans]WVL91328.1 FliC/FljB family flagellin [Pantoea agglomerans]
MAQVINTNSLSLITQNNINKNQSALSTSMERLSSGLRINSAKDDAAGQAIANRFTSNIKGLTQAARNANDGISAAQTTEGALSEINNNLQRVRELTVQAQNGTNSDSDLGSIQDEIKSRLSEIDRVSGQTQFNGVNVLAKDGKMSIQVGSNDGQTIDIDLKKIDSSTLGLNGFSVAKNSLSVGDAIKEIPGAASGDAPIQVSFDSSVATDLGITDASKLTLRNVKDSDGKATGTYVVQNGDKNYAASVAKDGTVKLNKADVTYNDAKNGVSDATQTGQLITVTADKNGDAVGSVTIQGKTFAATGSLVNANGATNAAAATKVTIKTDAATATQQKTIELSDTVDPTTGKVSTEATAEFAGAASNNPLALLDKAIASVDNFRSSLGAVQNRLNSAVTNLNNTTTNLSAAQSRIQDADYATEVSNMSKAQIVQQAGNSVLGKANQVPQQVLSLLQG